MLPETAEHSRRLPRVCVDKVLGMLLFQSAAIADGQGADRRLTGSTKQHWEGGQLRAQQPLSGGSIRRSSRCIYGPFSYPPRGIRASIVGLEEFQDSLLTVYNLGTPPPPSSISFLQHLLRNGNGWETLEHGEFGHLFFFSWLFFSVTNARNAALCGGSCEERPAECIFTQVRQRAHLPMQSAPREHNTPQNY